MRHLGMVLPLVLLFASWIFPLLPSESDAQTVEWTKRYNGVGNWDDVPSALAVDPEGNVYVTGASYGAQFNHDYVTKV